MRIKLLFLTLFIGWISTVVGQDKTISGTTNLEAPISMTSPCNWSQFIYLSSEINQSGGGNITELTFYVKSPSGVNSDKFNKWTVKVGHTSRSNFEYSNWEYKKITGLTTVCTDKEITYNSSTGEMKIEFTTPFSYNGSDNLVVEILENVAGSGKSNNYDGCKGKSTNSDVRTIKQNKYSAINPNSITGVNGYYTDKKVPNVTIHFQANTPYAVNALTKSQANAGSTVNIGSTNVELIALNAQISGSTGTAKQMQTIKFDLTGTTSVSDLSNVKLFYGTGNNIGSATEVTGATLSSPLTTTGTNTFSAINKNLASGNNYFFITFDASSEASAVGHTIDADITSVVTTDGTHTSASGTPTITGNITGKLTLGLKPLIIGDTGIAPICGTTSPSNNAPAFYNDDKVWIVGGVAKPNSWSALLYKPSELGNSAKKIKKIGFYVDCTSSSSACSYGEATNQTIYMKLVSNNPIVNYASNLQHPSNGNLNGYTKVFSGSVTWKRGASSGTVPTVIELSPPFDYDGTQNVLVYYKNQNGDELSGSTACSSTPPFLYASSAFPESANRNVLGKAKSDGTRTGTPSKGFLPYTYFEFEASSTPPTPITITLPANTSICAGETYTFTGVTVTPTDATLQWTSANGGTFDNAIILNPTYTPSTAEVNAGTATLRLTATKNGVSEHKDFTLTINPKPISIISKK